MDANVFSEGTPVRETGLELCVADLLISAATFGARPASSYKRYGYPIPHLPFGHVAADFCHYARKLMPGDVRQLDVWIMTFPAMPVAAAYACALDLDNHTVTFRSWICDSHQLRRLRKGFVNYSFHDNYLC
jgi:hypothetical protein